MTGDMLELTADPDVTPFIPDDIFHGIWDAFSANPPESMKRKLGEDTTTEQVSGQGSLKKIKKKTVIDSDEDSTPNSSAKRTRVECDDIDAAATDTPSSSKKRPRSDIDAAATETPSSSKKRPRSTQNVIVTPVRPELLSSVRGQGFELQIKAGTKKPDSSSASAMEEIQLNKDVSVTCIK